MAYLTIDEYLARFGERETALLSNTVAPQVNGATSYDPTKVETAIDDATEEVEGYISRRYATPLDNPPRIVKGWVAAFARLKLAEGTGRVSQAITDASDRVDAQLAQLVANKLNLPVDDLTTAPAPVGAGAALVSGDRVPALFSGGGLAGYTDVFTGGAGYAPCWRQGS